MFNFGKADYTVEKGDRIAQIVIAKYEAIEWEEGDDLSDSVRGAGGFGYDPYFFLPDLACTAAELDPDRKNQLSHRGRACRDLLKALKDADWLGPGSSANGDRDDALEEPEQQRRRGPQDDPPPDRRRREAERRPSGAGDGADRDEEGGSRRRRPPEGERLEERGPGTVAVGEEHRRGEAHAVVHRDPRVHARHARILGAVAARSRRG